MLSQLLIISRPIITWVRGRCSQLDTHPLILQYIVFWRAGVSQPTRLDPHATRSGWRLRHPHNQILFFPLFIKEWGGRKVSHWIQAGAARPDLTQYWRAIARLARSSEKGRDGEKGARGRACVCEGKIKFPLCAHYARWESCQNPLCSDWCGDSNPLWGKVASSNCY